MFKINDQISISVFLEDREIVLSNGNALLVCHIATSAKNALPVLRLEIIDVLNNFINYGLTDNSLIQVSIKTNIVVDRKFRVFSWQRTPFGEGHTYVIDAYFDYPKYLTGTTNKSATDSSSSLLSKIAAECGIPYFTQSAQTADTMTWHQGNKTNAKFARDIALHGAVSEKSHMMLAIDSVGVMRYIDLNASRPIAATLAYTVVTSGSFTVTDFKPIAGSGMKNHQAGYRHERVVQSLTKPSVIEAIDYAPDSAKPLMNSTVRGKIERAKVSYSPIDFGNSGEYYDKALYQNVRYNMLKSLGAEFLVGNPTGLEPGDSFKFSTPKELRMSAYDGTYQVADKIIFIAGATYLEKVIAYRNGLDS